MIMNCLPWFSKTFNMKFSQLFVTNKQKVMEGTKDESGLLYQTKSQVAKL